MNALSAQRGHRPPGPSGERKTQRILGYEPSRNIVIREVAPLRVVFKYMQWQSSWATAGRHIACSLRSLARYGGEGGIRTPDTGFILYNDLANRRLQPLGHLSKYAQLLRAVEEYR